MTSLTGVSGSALGRLFKCALKTHSAELVFGKGRDRTFHGGCSFCSRLLAGSCLPLLEIHVPWALPSGPLVLAVPPISHPGFLQEKGPPSV